YLSQNYPQARSIKYYREIEGDTTLYEINFKSKEEEYNLLLYPDGRIYETEIVMDFNLLPETVRNKITQDLQVRYNKYTIRLTEQLNPDVELKYEVKVRAKKGNHSGYFEVFYDGEGNFIEEEEETIKSIPSNSGF
ncbi:MAG: hypothetical protein K2X86_10290, partial [Cytophagaceae bacterium]|nr:hypothetical protein [Cytophagaceae bacterium]